MAYTDRQLYEYLPPVLQNVREYRAIFLGHQPELYDVFAQNENLYNDQFILTLTEYGVERWEKFFNLIVRPNMTLDDRRFEILTRLSEELPYTMVRLKQLLTQLSGDVESVGFSVDMDYENRELRVLVNLSRRFQIDACQKLLQRIAPANLVVTVEPWYNQNSKLGKYTHRELAAYTQDQLRNDDSIV